MYLKFFFLKKKMENVYCATVVLYLKLRVVILIFISFQSK